MSGDEKYEPMEVETEAEEMRRKAHFSNRIELLWLRILKLEQEQK